MEENKEQNKERKSGFKSGSLFDRWESDGEDFINFYSSDEDEDEREKRVKE